MDYRFVFICNRIGPGHVLGLQEIAWNLKGQVVKCDHREYGFAIVQIAQFGQGSVDALFEDLGDEMQVHISPSQHDITPLSSAWLRLTRFGCPMEIKFRIFPKISMSLVERRLLHLLP